MSLLTMTLCYVKQFLLWYYRESIHKLRTFIVERQFCSGDSSYDSTVRSGFYRNAQNLVTGIFGLILLDQIMIAAPSPLRKRYFGIPSWFYSYGEATALVVELAFYPTFIIVWVSKLFCSSATVAIVLNGLRTELQILAQYYGHIMKGLQLEVCSDPSKFHRHFRKSPQTRSWFWSQLRLRTGVGVQHHVHILEYLHLLQPVFEKIFFLIYYQALIVAGAVFYVTMRDEFTVCSVAVLMCMSISVLECYWWCHLVDSFQDVNNTLSHHLTNQCSQLPHSADHHSEYVQMRTTCMIIAERAHRGVEFSCVGMFTISTAAFANLLNVCYSVLMFLINVCDKVDPVKQFQLWMGSKM
ncbi:conserved hypothetical protein [Culex quinquefasciatus]|nr:conserved hypothetical protein [Culex quinquefasciatus]|eukprot:XP_001850952.1 conserved hypothetical protein [Culex quinquefasciatus]